MLAVLLGFPGLDDCKIFVGGGYRNPSMWGDSIGAGIFFCKVSASPSSETSKQFEVWKYRFWKIRSSWILTKKYIPGTWQGPNSNENRGRIYIISYSKNDNSQKLQEKPMCFIIQSSLSNWVVFHSLYTLNNQWFCPCSHGEVWINLLFDHWRLAVAHWKKHLVESHIDSWQPTRIIPRSMIFLGQEYTQAS